MRKPKQCRIVRDDSHGARFYLKTNRLEDVDYPRSISCAQIRAIFKACGRLIYVNVRYTTGLIEYGACFDDGILVIGCQHFPARETQKIRRWAFKKRAV